MIELSLVLLIAVIFTLGYYIIYRFGCFADIIEHARGSSFENSAEDSSRGEYTEYSHSSTEHRN